MELFLILLLAGLILLGAEIFVPGGVLGVVGALALAGAVGMGFVAFGPVIGTYVAIVVALLAGVAIVLWMIIFPRTRLGRNMTVSRTLQGAKAGPAESGALVGQEGEALSDLRPAGYAQFANRRVDVVTSGGYVAQGARVKVVRVEGARVVVQQVG